MNLFPTPDIYSLLIHPIALATLSHLGIFLSSLCVCFYWILFHESPLQERQIIGEAAMQPPCLSPHSRLARLSHDVLISQCRSFTSSAWVSPALWIFPDSALPTLLTCYSLPTTRVEVPLLCTLWLQGCVVQGRRMGEKGNARILSAYFLF